MSNAASPARKIAYEMLCRGCRDEEIMEQLRDSPCNPHDHRQTIALARAYLAYEQHGGPVRRRGPWPVEYVRDDGQRMFRVGAGHVVGERSLEALGFRHE